MIHSIDDDALLRVTHLVNRPAKNGKPAERGMCGIAKASLYRLLAENKFPAPVRPLPGVVAWRAGDVRQWLRSHSK